jgi:hypothetical protein
MKAVENKIQSLLEDIDLINHATDAFNSYLKNNPTEAESKDAMNFIMNNNISPHNADTTLANMASGVGKTMDSNEAMSIYNKSEQGQNTIPQSHALQKFFTDPNKGNDSFDIQKLKRGYGKEIDQNKLVDILKNTDKPDTFFKDAVNEYIPQNIQKDFSEDQNPSKAIDNLKGWLEDKPSDPRFQYIRDTGRQALYDNFNATDPKDLIASFSDRFNLSNDDARIYANGIDERELREFMRHPKEFQINNPEKYEEYKKFETYAKNADNLRGISRRLLSRQGQQ